MRPLAERLTERELLQRGDIAWSYRARDKVLERPVFVKLLNPVLAEDETTRARFEREAKAVARLDHPHLVRIYEFGEDPVEGPYMLLEWIEGATLAAVFARGERFTGERFEDLARQLLSGLAALHSVGILHRDLKPENVLVRTSPSPPTEGGGRPQYKITDFSLAALRDFPRLTHHEAIVGTPAYMAPEQAAGGVPTEASDLFSLGVILYEAATGVNPLLGESLLDTLRRIRESDISFEHAALVSLPRQGQMLLRALLEKEPSKRPLSARHAVMKLEGGEEAIPGVSAWPARNVGYAVAAVATITAGMVLLFTWPKSRDLPTGSSDRREQTLAISADTNLPEIRSPSSVESAETAFVSTTPIERRTEATDRVPARGRETKSEAASDREPGEYSDDSADVYLSTEPWAHVFYKGTQLGTTPLPEPLRLPRGTQPIELRHPAYPPIEVLVDLNRPRARQTVRLSDYVATLRVSAEPWGELYLDGEHLGTTPLPRPIYVSPGRHTLRVSHPQMAAVQKIVDLVAGQRATIRADLVRSELVIQTEEKR